MSKVKLSDSTFAVCPEGEHLFKIVKVEYDENFGLITMTLKTPDGYTDTERYQLITADNEVNEGAVGAFSYLAKCAMQDQTITEIDPLTLKNHFVKATISHSQKESTKKPGKMLTFTSLSDIESATEAEWNVQVPTKTASTSSPVMPKKTVAGFDLNALFGKK